MLKVREKVRRDELERAAFDKDLRWLFLLSVMLRSGNVAKELGRRVR